MSLRVEVKAEDPIRRRGLAAMLARAGFVLVHEAPDVVLCDDAARAAETEAPVVEQCVVPLPVPSFSSSCSSSFNILQLLAGCPPSLRSLPTP